MPLVVVLRGGGVGLEGALLLLLCLQLPLGLLTTAFGLLGVIEQAFLPWDVALLRLGIQPTRSVAQNGGKGVVARPATRDRPSNSRGAHNGGHRGGVHADCV